MSFRGLQKNTIGFFGFFSARFGLYLIVMVLSMVSLSTAVVDAADEPAISGGTNITGDIDTWFDVDGVTVSGTSEDPITVSLSVDSGDLRLQVTTGITFHNGIDSGDNINITGSIEDVNAALDSL